MKLRDRVGAWLDVRQNELSPLSFSILGAFLAMSFLVLARALREAFYLEVFDARTLPYITAATAVLSIPTVSWFARALSGLSPRRVFTLLVLILAAGLLALWPFVQLPLEHPLHNTVVVVFYLWTILGTLLLTTGFWVVTAELFPVRGARRLFGFIGAGGTAGAMVTGNLLVWLGRRFDADSLAPGLIAILLLILVIQGLTPKGQEAPRSDSDSARAPLLENLTLIWRSPHLRTIALIVFVVAVATTLLDYQFKELAQESFTTKEQLAAFFGAFYGWTGGIALIIQLLVVSRFLAAAGVAWSLAALPLMLLFGSAGLLLAPSLLLVVAVRGADASLRKSLYRFALEVVYVPVPSALRRRTKSFIDSVLDSTGEGVGAGLLFLWVTLPDFPSRYLSVFIILCSVALIVLSDRMRRHYLGTVAEQLQVSGGKAESPRAGRLQGADLLSGTFTRLDVSSLLTEPGRSLTPSGDATPPDSPPSLPVDIEERLRANDLALVARTLDEPSEFGGELLPDLIRLLARDPVLDRVVERLVACGDAAVPQLAAWLRDEHADFVIRRRIPRVLAGSGGIAADDALIDALRASRFEIRYRAAIALMRRREAGLPTSQRDLDGIVWDAIRFEASRGRPVWEMQRLLDDEPGEDGLVTKRIGVRGELSLEHTFRLLSLIREPEVVRAAFHGIILDDEKLKSFALEYLEQVLPADIRRALWPFIGDVSERQRRRSLRSLDQVVSDLMTTGATLFADAPDRERLKQILDGQPTGEE